MRISSVSFWCLVIFAVIPVECLFKKWLKNTDLNNPFNWDSGRIPCGNDRLILVDDGPVVFLQMNTTVEELVMPRSGEIVFGSYATLAFTNEPDHSAACLDSGIDCTFNASVPEIWMDPINWCPTDTETGGCKPIPLLHTEMIPCKTDNVVFPTGSSYYVDLGANLNIEINTLKVSGKAYSQDAFRNYLTTDDGRNVFPPPSSGRPSTVSIHRRRCTDMAGCGCGNDQGQLLEAVCNVQRPRCLRPQCRVGVRPVGHCCDICGGMMNVTIGVGFNLESLTNGLQRTIIDTKDSYKDIDYIVSKRSDGRIQIVLQDEDGVTSSAAAKAMFAELKKDIKNGGTKYSVTAVTLTTSTAGPSGGKTNAHIGKRSGSRGKVAAIVIGTIIGLCAIAALGLFVYKRRVSDPEGGSSGFNFFNKFNLMPERRPQIQVPSSIAFSWGSWGSRDSGLSSVGGGASQGFENPIYGSTPLEDMTEMTPPGDFTGMAEGQPIDDRGFDNPLYDNVHQESLFTDATAGEPEKKVVTIGGLSQDDDQTIA